MLTRKKISFIYTIVGIIGFTMILAVGVVFYKQHRFKKYVNHVHSFAIKYPNQWTFIEDKAGAAVIFYSPKESEYDSFQEGVNIVVQDLSAKRMDLQEYSDLAVYQMQVVFKHNLVILESSPMMLAGRPGHKFVFVGKTGEKEDLKYFIVWTLHDQKAYQVTYTAYASTFDKYINKVQRMVNSFKVL